jgi:hypothetical protein
VKRKRPTQRRYGGGYKESPLRPLTPEGKKPRREYLMAWHQYHNNLVFAEAECRWIC